eukprot:SAG31_NODE_19_length_35031_cov_42.510707_4_plen_745_part_00
MGGVGPVWKAGQHGAGLFLAFQTDSAAVYLNASLLSEASESLNCGVACNAGVDLYAYDSKSSAWRWVDTAWPGTGGWSWSGTTIHKQMIADPALPSRGTTRYRLHLPIYNGFKRAAIGTLTGSKFGPDVDDDNRAAPILFYGTSIVNGHVASRPGMIFTHVLSRNLNRDVINLGFGGQGTMDPSIGRLISEMKQVAMVVIDCNWNMRPENITSSAVKLVLQLRKHWSASKPLVLAEGSDAGAAWINRGIRATQAARRAALRAAYAQLHAAHVPKLFYVVGEALIGTSGQVDTPTAMGTHPTDLGHHLIAQYYTNVLPSIVAGTTRPLQPQADWLKSSEQETSNIAWAKSTTTSQAKKTTCSNQDISWTIARSELHVGGRAPWTGHSRENFYDRFPYDARQNVTSGGGGPGIWGLSKCSTGEFIGFSIVGNVTSLWVNYSVADKYGQNPSGGKLPIMPPIGRNGVDLYAQNVANGEWFWAGNFGGVSSRTVPVEHVCGPLTALTDDDVDTPIDTMPLDSAAAAKYMLYLPLWRACGDDLAIGIPAAEAAAGAKLVPEAGTIDGNKKPVVWYGTSIVHGAASTRAGAGFTNRISRGINRTILNFGFSGSGHMDLGIGMWLQTIDAAVFIIDCNWNMNAAEVRHKAGPIVSQLRDAHPTTPIVLAEGTPDGTEWFYSTHREEHINSALRTVYESLKADKNLHYVESSRLYNSTGPLVNPTVGGCHPSDLGAQDVATFYIDFLRLILQ